MPQATQAQLQNLVKLGYVSPDLIASLPLAAVLTRIHWVFITDEDYAGDIDRWVDYAEAHYPGLDIEALDIAIGCC
jgi:hypothetical protein